MAAIATGACWGIVIVTWIVLGAYGARHSRGSRRGADSGWAWRIGLVAVAILVVRFAGRDLRDATDRSLWIEIPGLVLLVVSTAFTLWARVRLGRMWSGSPGTLQTDHELRTDGPYAVTRHPIYTGIAAMLIGTVLLNGLGVSLVILAIGLTVLATRIPVEERLMSETFPDEYACYRKRVPLLVPGLRLLRRLPHRRRRSPACPG
jgi:protein-S-isoprenylcysteine O-methyltransferase Ste14